MKGNEWRKCYRYFRFTLVYYCCCTLGKEKKKGPDRSSLFSRLSVSGDDRRKTRAGVERDRKERKGPPFSIPDPARCTPAAFSLVSY